MQDFLHIFAYLQKHLNSEMVLDPSETDINMNYFQHQDWSYSVYSLPGEELKEVLPTNMPQPLGNGFKIHCFVEYDHAGESLTVRSRTSFIVMLNNDTIYWYSNKQSEI